tara:strand:+ start:516 stop:1259 length:744 start_codon:yes stop_codon:yes gene_type:complete
MKLYRLIFLFTFSLFCIGIAQDDDDFEFEDDDFEFEEDDFDLDDLDDFDLEDDDFDELLEEFELEEEEGFEEGEPRKFSIGISTGMLIPFGANIKARFNSGLNLGLNVNTPWGFYFGPFEIIFGANFSYSSLSPIKDDYLNPDDLPYTITSFAGTAKTKILFFDTTAGVAYTSASANSVTEDVAVYGELVNKGGLSIIVDVIYPINLGPIDLGINFKAKEILTTPGGIPGETSDLIGFGINLNYKFN